ncbi:MAG: hypothetical protein ACFFE8_06285 [Candidatus Heimdallarchaeota archaeon]
MMMRKGINQMINSLLVNKILSLVLIGIITISFYVGLSNTFMDVAPSYHESEDFRSQRDFRLMSLMPYNLANPSFEEEKYSKSAMPETTGIYDNSEVYESQTANVGPKSPPRFHVGGSSDGHVGIDKISPEAMEINATEMQFTLNFTIINSPGNPSSALKNLTISNTTNTFRITTWSNWYFRVSPLTNNYSLNFILNSTVLSGLTFGEYNLTIFTDILGHISSDFIPLPMKDLRVLVTGITKGGLPYSEFNNKFGEDQHFNVTLQVTVFDGTSTNAIQVLPKVFDTFGLNINPNVTLISEAGDQINLLYLSSNGFVDNSSTSAGIFKFEVNLTKDIATFEKYPDGNNTLKFTVTSNDGISAAATAFIDSKGTVLIVKYKTIKIGSNNPLDYDNLTDNAGLIEIRVNPNEEINVTYEVIDNGTGLLADGQKVVGQLLSYQDPNQAGDPFAINTTQITITANGTVTLTASVITPSFGYPLLFYVRGHRTSQEQTPSNITIYWDQLTYQYTYIDNLGDTGSNSNFNQKALGVDTNSWWGLQLSVFYASDNSPALSSQISYRFSGQLWQNLTDGNAGDLLDGKFFINYTHPFPEVILFECMIANGSIMDPQGTLFVNETTISRTFNLDVTWTYLIVDLIPTEADERLGTSIQTSITLNAYWAHDSSVFNGFLVGSDWLGIERDLTLVAGQGIWSGLIQIDTGSYRYRIIRIDDPLFGISRFTNTTAGNNVFIDLIWDEIYFTYSNSYNSSMSPAVQNFQEQTSFFANFGTNATLYIYGSHSYDGAPFQGLALLYDFDRVDSYPLDFNSDGVAIWRGDLSDARLPVTFSVMEITSASVEDWGVTTVYTGGFTEVIISWDKIVITFVTDLVHRHGEWADVSIEFTYLVYDTQLVNLSSVTYDLLLTNGTLRSGISWVNFRDFSMGPAKRSYNVTGLFDPSTGITGFETRYRWLDRDMDEAADGNLVIVWIDDQPPRVLDFRIIDLANGTVLIVVDFTDDGEGWKGSGIVNASLWDRRPSVNRQVPDQSIFTSGKISEGVWRYGFRYSFNQNFTGIFNESYFQFGWNETLRFTIEVWDDGSLILPGVGELSPALRRETNEFSIRMNRDGVTPKFHLLEHDLINYTYLDVDDGAIRVHVHVQDFNWSGLNLTSVILTVTDESGEIETNYTMQPDGPINVRKRNPLDYVWNITLTPGLIYDLRVWVTDIAGNTNSSEITLTVVDKAPPRIGEPILGRTEDRKLNITVEIFETGSGIASVSARIDGHEEWYELNPLRTSGGFAASISQTGQFYSVIIPLDLDLGNVILPKDYKVIIRAIDGAGNQKFYEEDRYKLSLGPLILEPVILIAGAVLLIIAIVVGIRITSRTEGYDVTRIIRDSERISHQTILTLMDEYALGVTVNFFDQVQGPVPVIWEPPLLEDQEQVMLDLSDKSFSTLEFVGLEEEERSGTFDFSTGSYDCTALGYSFAVDNPQARGGKENLTIVLLLRKEWGDNLLTFQDELVEKLREIREMIENKEDPSKIASRAHQLREFVSRIMISFNKIYKDVNYEENLEVE